MKSIAYIILLSSFGICYSQSQAEMTDIAMKELEESIELKDSLKKEVLRIYLKDSSFVSTFNKSETIWEAFVQEQFKLEFPAFESWKNRHQIYGSSFEMCYYYFLKRYLDFRIITIRNLINEEGDVCGD